jgi:Tol biopolymer transport system component
MAYTKRLGSGFAGNSDIYIYDFKTKMEKPVANDTIRESAPSWSPDGKKLVYTVLTNLDSGIRFADLNLWVVNVQSGEKKEILKAEGAKMYNPVWAPVGNKIVYYLEKGDNRDQIYITDENGSYHINLTADTSTHNYYPSWKGEQILYTQSREKIIIMNQDGSGKSVINGLHTSRAFYNAKTDKIAFVSPFSDRNQPFIRIYDIKTKQITNIISNEELSSLKF